MTSYPSRAAAASVLLLLGSYGAVDAAKAATPKQRMEFLRAMNQHGGAGGRGKKVRRKLTKQDERDFQALVHGDSAKSAALRQKIMDKAVRKEDVRGTERKLYSSSNANSASSSSSSNANAYQANNNNNNANYDNGKSTDDYFNTYGEWENTFGFDYSQFSLSYYRCAAVSQYDDNVAALEDTTDVFATQHFAVFRFCPTKTCMGFMDDDFCDASKLGTVYCQMMRDKAEFGERAAANEQDDEQAEEAAEDCDEETMGKEYCQMLAKQEAWEEAQMAETVLYGARGEGCQDNYGEYMIELEDYLQLMLEYQMERFQQYCTYCEECMYNVYQIWLNQGGVQGQQDDAVQQDAANDDGVDPTYYQVCPEYNTCSSYKNLCEEEIEETYSQYFECTEMEAQNGQVGYIGPHCAEDGFTVTLGVYADEDCNRYIGNGVDISNFINLEIDVDEDALKPWYNSANGALEVLQYSNEDNVCIPCNKNDLPYETIVDYDEAAQYADEAAAEKELNEICESVFQVSARCHKHFHSYTSRSQMAKYREVMAQEDLSCDFINSVVMGSFNEMGFVQLQDDGDAGWLQSKLGGSLYAQEYAHHVTAVSPLQVFGLVASLAACAVLGLWSTSLKKSLAKGPGWTPTRHRARQAAAEDVQRVDSGIMLGRTATDTSYYMS